MLVAHLLVAHLLVAHLLAAHLLAAAEDATRSAGKGNESGDASAVMHGADVCAGFGGAHNQQARTATESAGQLRRPADRVRALAVRPMSAVWPGTASRETRDGNRCRRITRCSAAVARQAAECAAARAGGYDERRPDHQWERCEYAPILRDDAGAQRRPVAWVDWRGGRLGMHVERPRWHE